MNVIIARTFSYFVCMCLNVEAGANKVSEERDCTIESNAPGEKAEEGQNKLMI